SGQSRQAVYVAIIPASYTKREAATAKINCGRFNVYHSRPTISPGPVITHVTRRDAALAVTIVS
ncbi:MAG: hypothetical protein Q8R28_08160, partial [Dehalococcoidia bacterium]|nr:hypothetical protein [Dehalococcoidia bacterium]